MAIVKKLIVPLASGATLLTQTAHAETSVVYTNLHEGDSETIDGTISNDDRVLDRARESYDNTVETLRSQYSWIKLVNEPITSGFSEKKRELEKLRPTLQRIEELREKLLTIHQQAAQSSVTIHVVNNEVFTPTDVQKALTELEHDIESVNTALEGSHSITVDALLMTLIRDTNRDLATAALIDNHSEDGIVGNLDDIHRASYDSRQPGVIRAKSGPQPGVVVDITKTNRPNVVTTDHEDWSKNVKNGSDVATARDAVLKKIADTHQQNTNEVVRAGVYRDNALTNIASINKWLQKEQDRANNIQDEIDKNMTAVRDMDVIKQQALTALQEAEQTIRSSGKAQDVIDKMLALVNQARARLNNGSGVTQKQVDTIDATKNIDFGDIGRDPNIINRIQHDASEDINKRVDSALANLQRDNAAAQAALDPWKPKAKEAIDAYLDSVRKGHLSAGQIEESWLTTRSIYTTDHNGYANFVKAALAQANEEHKNLLTRQGDMWIAPDGTPAAKAAAAYYHAKSSGDLEHSLGSVMLPSANVNDFVTVEGTKLANSQKDGGAEAIINKLAGAYGGIRNLQPIKDLMTQHIAKVGNDKTFFVVSEKPSATFKLANSFLYKDDKDEPKTTDMTLTMNITDETGGAFGAPKADGKDTYPLYFYYMSVDAASGKLIAGGGYFGFVGKSGLKEMATGAGTDVSDSGNLDAFIQRANGKLGIPADMGNPFASKGIRLTLDTKINPVVGKYSTNTPLYMTSVGDHHVLSTSGDIIVSAKSAAKYNAAKVLSDSPSRDANNGHTNIDEQSALITQNQPVSISHPSDGDKPYTSINVGLFAPWGVIGGTSPDLKLPDFNFEVRTFGIANPNAVAHTDGSYTVKKLTGTLKYGPDDNSSPNKIRLPLFKVATSEFIPTSTMSKVAASSTSIVVRQLVENLTKNERGNALVVREVASRYGTNDDTPALSVRSLQSMAYSYDTGSALAIRQISSPLRLNKDQVIMDVYVDPSLRDIANEAVKDWQVALEKHGVHLRVVGKRKVASLAILDGDNTTTRAARTTDSRGVEEDSMFEMKGLAGLTTFTRQVGIVGLDSNDKLNRTGTFSVEDLKQTKHVIQLNSESIRGRANLIKVLKHELGHVFGLQHDNKNPLMTTYYNDRVFTGEITDDIGAQVAANLRGGILCQCAACACMRQQ